MVLGLTEPYCLHSHSIGNIVVYAHGKRIWLLEHHANLTTQTIEINAAIVDILTKKLNPTFNAHFGF
jgi:hypothetical protein